MLHVLGDIMKPKIRSKHFTQYNFIQNQHDGTSCATTKNKTFNGIGRGCNKDLSIVEFPLFYRHILFPQSLPFGVCIIYIYILIW